MAPTRPVLTSSSIQPDQRTVDTSHVRVLQPPVPRMVANEQHATRNVDRCMEQSGHQHTSARVLGDPGEQHCERDGVERERREVVPVAFESGIMLLARCQHAREDRGSGWPPARCAGRIAAAVRTVASRSLLRRPKRPAQAKVPEIQPGGTRRPLPGAGAGRSPPAPTRRAGTAPPHTSWGRPATAPYAVATTGCRRALDGASGDHRCGGGAAQRQERERR